MDEIRREIEAMPKFIKIQLTTYSSESDPAINDILRQEQLNLLTRAGPIYKMLIGLDAAFVLVTPLKTDMIVHKHVTQSFDFGFIDAYTKEVKSETVPVRVPAGTSMIVIPRSVTHLRETDTRVLLYRGGEFVPGTTPDAPYDYKQPPIMPMAYELPSEDEVRAYMHINRIILDFIDTDDMRGFASFVSDENREVVFRCLVGDTEIRPDPMLIPYFQYILGQSLSVIHSIDGLSDYLELIDVFEWPENIYTFEYKKLPFWFQKSLGVDIQQDDENCSPKRQSLIGQVGDFLKETCDFLPLEDITSVYGPISYNEFRIGDRKIGIFGEAHIIHARPVDKKTTVTPAALINSILKSNPSTFYDFFLELDYVFPRHAGISHFDHLFRECLTFVKNCPYENLRAHYVDTRPVAVSGSLNDVIDYMYSTDTLNARYMKAQMYRIKKDVKEYIISNKKLKKETGNIRAHFIQYIYDNLIRLELVLDTALRNYVDNPSASNRVSFYEALMHYASLAMDTYTLGRIFKTFNTARSNPTHPTTATNCIVYVGDAHAEEYCKFLSTYMRARPVVSIRSESQLLYFSERDKSRSFLFN